MIENKEGLKYSLEKSYYELEKFVEENSFHYMENEVYYRVGNCLMWICAGYDRLCNNNTAFNKNDVFYMSAIRGANNLQKHNCELFKLHVVKGGVECPIEFPLIIEEVKLLFASVAIGGSKFKNQIDNYNKILAGQSIIETLQKAKDIVTKKL